MNIYKDILRQNLPKLLNLYDLDPASESLGVGDRLNWGWKVSDFANATLQGGVHALAIAIRLKIVHNEKLVLSIIDKVIRAIPAIGRKNGSMQEAYPSEHSFCVTALVAFDVLSCIHYLENRISDETRAEYLRIIAPLIDFITKNDEEHAIISNHLATGVAAIAIWNRLTGDSNSRHESLLSIIEQHQSSEGWHLEYEGADPGYQTLCLYYLSAAAQHWRSDRLRKSMDKAVSFLQHMVHPDGTIGGLHGSRNTEVYYPGGILSLAAESGTAASLAKTLEYGVLNQRHLLPQFIDIGNYCPCLNAYAHAAWHRESNMTIEVADALQFDQEVEHDFPESGLFVKSTAAYFAIVNYKKGGTIKVYDQKNKTLDIEDGGLLATLNNGKKCSTQSFDPRADFNSRQLKTAFFALNQSTPSPFTTIVLRSLGLTVFRSVALGNAFKKAIVKMLMTGKKPLGGHATRVFDFQPESITVTEEINPPKGTVEVGHVGKFKSIHMASSGYFITPMQEKPEQSNLVTFR